MACDDIGAYMYNYFGEKKGTVEDI